LEDPCHVRLTDHSRTTFYFTQNVLVVRGCSRLGSSCCGSSFFWNTGNAYILLTTSYCWYCLLTSSNVSRYSPLRWSFLIAWLIGTPPCLTALALAPSKMSDQQTVKFRFISKLTSQVLSLIPDTGNGSLNFLFKAFD